MNARPPYSVYPLAFFLGCGFLHPLETGGVASAQPARSASPRITFARIRALSLSQVRALALERAPTIALAQARVGASQAEQRELSRRLKLSSAGGLDPFSGKVRFYLSLDLERLLQLNKQEREKARRTVEADRIGQAEAQNAALKGASQAWFDLRRASLSQSAATRNLITARALYTGADARFKSGTGELASVLSALSGQSAGEDALTGARQNVLLACLDLAQACGYATAEEMESALNEAPRKRKMP